jgi:pantetheine-phosphate adenylyltransferase
MEKIAVFPGSFDPITVGHADILERALPIFDKVFIALGNNYDKKYLFTVDKREEWLKNIYGNNEKIKVIRYDGLTIDFCRRVSAHYIIRGIRTSADFEFERMIAQMNSQMASEIETVFFISRPEYAHISSTVVRDIIRNKGDYKKFVPQEVTL